MNRINNDNLGNVLDKMIAEIEGNKEGDPGTFYSECEALLNYIGPDAEYSCLLLLFWGLMATLYKTGYSNYSQPSCKIAFSAIKELIRRKEPTAVRDLIQFTRDDLFIIYLEDRFLYYTIVNEFYLTIHDGYPIIYKDGYVNIYNIINGLEDSGYMDADYIYSGLVC